ncbi:hypothetical protein Q5752_001774 [Cryptotrichosporon argae]
MFARRLSSLAAAHTLLASSPYIRAFGNPGLAPHGLRLFPAFFTPAETLVLARAALWKLDGMDGTRRRRRRRGGAGASAGTGVEGAEDRAGDLQHLFEGEYGFEEGHFDAVIDGYRESLLTALPPEPALPALLGRLLALLPPRSSASSASSSPSSFRARHAHSPPPPPHAAASAGTTTHVLHLSPTGEIRPHVDHLDAMGATIVGASLGAERVLRLERARGGGGAGGAGGAPVEDEAGQRGPQAEGGWDVLLPSGSVYIQTGDVRYGLAHSVLGYAHPASAWAGRPLVPGHRISVMVRDTKA